MKAEIARRLGRPNEVLAASAHARELLVSGQDHLFLSNATESARQGALNRIDSNLNWVKYGTGGGF